MLKSGEIFDRPQKKAENREIIFFWRTSSLKGRRDMVRMASDRLNRHKRSDRVHKHFEGWPRRCKLKATRIRRLRQIVRLIEDSFESSIFSD